MTKINDRVGAVIGENNNVITFLGYGVYEGDFCPKEAVGFLAEVARDIPDIVNPRIKLDNGGVVYGCECWWGPEENVKKLIRDKENAGCKINIVSIDDIRAKWKED